MPLFFRLHFEQSIRVELNKHDLIKGTLHLFFFHLLHCQRLHLHHALLLLHHSLLLLQVLSLPVSRETFRLLAVDFHRNVLQMIRLGHLRCTETSHVRIHHLLHVVCRQRGCEALQFGIRQQSQR